MALPTLPDGPFTLTDVTIPGCFLGQDTELLRTTLSIADGQITDGAHRPVPMGGAMVLLAFVDMHTHLDKGHISPRSPNPDGSFDGAIMAVRRDVTARWSAEDVRARMTFSLRSAYAYGTRAIRTHLDSHAPQDAISWGVFK
ncbi:MAG: cytosine deaminase, partial [Pseudomonadota bacterium]